jgi:elongation factor Ts
MECKKALTETNGDFDEAVKVLREKGLAVAAKKASRIAAEGVVDIMVSEDGKTAAMIEVNAETDFVAKNAVFGEFVTGLLKTLLTVRPANNDEFFAARYLDTDFTVEAKLKDMVFTIGENMNIRRFVIVDGNLATYIHGKGTTGVIVKLIADDETAAKEGFAEIGKNIALQIAAGTPPTYISKADVPQSAIDEEVAIQVAAAKNDPKLASKPDAVLAKIVEGKLGKLFFEKVCLLEQAYVKDDSMKVGQYVNASAKAFGGVISVDSFYLYEKGEGIAKREENFAEEIAKMVNN